MCELQNMEQSNTANAVTDDVMLEVSLEECIQSDIMEGEEVEEVDEQMDWVFGPSLNEEVEHLSDTED